MGLEISFRRMIATVAGVALSASLVGCTSSSSVAFTNMSDTWVNVSYFVKGPAGTMTRGTGEKTDMEMTTEGPATFVARDKMQIKPGETARYQLARNTNYKASTYPIVHVQIEPVTPTWESTGRIYWLELLTEPPLTIVATGSAEELTFLSRDGSLAKIPEQRQVNFEHRMATVNEPSK